MVEEKKTALEREEKSEKCPTRLLDDLPVDHDAFGSHQRIARAIAELIKNEEGGKAIALIGPWGSGKTTVVKLLEKELEIDKAIAIFAFDAWGHQGDPLRRSFLERFIDWLLKKRRWLTNDAKWEKEKEIIARRLRFTRSFPRLTRAGTIMSFVTLLLPTGLALLSQGDKQIANIGSFELLAWHIGISLSLLPFGLLFTMWLLSLCPRIRAWLVGAEISYTDVLSLLLAGQIKDNVVHETPDPTSVEFQTTFTKALSEALNKNSNRRLVIVVDNLDRVSTKDALKIWATLRPFFKWEESVQQPEWAKRLWLIVPFAPNTPQRLWKEASRENSKHGGAQEHLHEESEEADKQKPLADEFVEKTFQIRFHVPLPVMSDWREFFEGQLKKEAFRKHFQHHSNDLHVIYHVFDAKRASNHRPPTPREIKLFINQLGAYHRVWQDEIPLPVQAWYVLAVHDLIAKHGPEHVLVEEYEELLGKDAQRFFKHEARLQEYLAALYFNVEIDKAMQVLIGEEAREALRTGDKRKLKELQEKVRPPEAFLAVVDRELSNGLAIWVEEDASTLAKAAWASSDLKQEGSSILGALWEQLINSAGGVEWSALDEQVVVDGLITLLQRSRDRHKALGKALLAHIQPPSAPVEGGEEQEQQVDATTIANWTKGLDRLLREIQRSGNEDVLQNFQVPGNAAFYVAVMREAVQLKDTLLLQLNPQVSADKVVKHLADLCSKAKFDRYYAEVVRALSEKGWNWHSLVVSISQRLRSLQEIGPVETIGCLRALLYLEGLKTSPPVAQVFKELAERGDLLHCMHLARGNDEAISLCVLLMLEHNPEGRLPSVPSGSQASNGLSSYKSILSSQPADSIQYLADLTKEFSKGNALLRSAMQANEARPLVLSVLSRVIEEGDMNGYPLAERVVDQYRFLEGGLQEAVFGKLLQQLAEDGSLLDAIRQRDFTPELADLYLQTLEISPAGEAKERFIEFLHAGLRGIPKERWLRELGTAGPLLDLVIALVDEGAAPALEQHFHDALVEHVQQLLSGAARPPEDKKRWIKLIDAMADSEKKTFPGYVLKEILKQVDKPAHSVLWLYGDLLLEDEDIVVKEADDIVGQLFKGILDRKLPEELDWLARALRRRPEIVTNCGEAYRESFRKRLENSLREADGEQIRKHLEQVADAAIAAGLELKYVFPDDGDERGDGDEG
jgi:hypothetical protein